MKELQALVTGAVLGCLMKAPEDAGLLIDVEPEVDEQGYTNVLNVRGQESGERVRIVVEEVTP